MLIEQQWTVDRVTYLGHGKFIFTFWEFPTLISIVASPALNVTNSEWRFWFAHSRTPQLCKHLLSVLYNFVILTEKKKSQSHFDLLMVLFFKKKWLHIPIKWLCVANIEKKCQSLRCRYFSSFSLIICLCFTRQLNSEYQDCCQIMNLQWIMWLHVSPI